MRNMVSGYVEKFKHVKQVRRRVTSIIVALALVVSCGVYWELREDGMAMVNETFCGMDEHLHGEECYEQVLTCGFEEDAPSEHTHTGACYEEVLICDIPEHVHDITCLNDETADVESAADWEATLPKGLSGVWADDVAAIAESQVGYTESEANFRLAEDGETRQGYTRYGEWYGSPYGDWDAMFASFCLYYAGVPEEYFPQASGVYAWISELKKAGLYEDGADYIPAAGDLVFFDTDKDDRADTVAIVTAAEYEPGEEAGEESDAEIARPVLVSLTVVRGDCGDAVCENEYAPDEVQIVGYGILPMQAAPEEEEAAIGDVRYAAEDGGVSVTVTAPAGALPEGAELTVTLYEEYSPEYAGAAEAIGADAGMLSAGAGTETGMAVLDISFLLDGEEVEPSEPVQVSLDASALVPEDAENIVIWHLEETKNGAEPEVVATLSAESPVAEFEVESFSAFTVTWTMATGATAGTTYSLSVTAYLDGIEIDDISGLTFNSENDELDFETLLSDVDYGTGDYTFSYAIVTVGNQTYGTQENPVIAIEIDQGTGGPTASSNFLIVYADGSTDTVSTSSEVNVSAYYLTPDFSVSIEAADEDESTEAWAMQAVLSHAGEYESISYEWTVTDSDGVTSLYAAVTNTDNTGRAYIVWEEGTPDNTEVTVSVTVTLTLEDGSTKTATADYVLEYGDETVDLIMTYGPDKASLPAGVTVTLTSASGDVYTGTTDSDGWVHDLEIEPGIYTVTATYTDSEGNTYQCNETVAFHDAGNYSINLNYYNEEILTSVPNRSNWEHIDIKVSVGETGSADASNVSVDIIGCQIIGSDGTVKYTATADSIEGNDNEFQLTFYEGEDTTGTPGHSIEFDTTDTITITYVLTIDGEQQDQVTITITSSTTYEEGTTYPATGQRAYKLYNYLYGTSYSSDAQLIADGIEAVDISGMSMMLVAAILCDSSEVTGAGQVQAVDGQSANQWGMDFALSIETMQELAAGWSFDIKKTYENHSMTVGDFTFYLYSATVEDGIWTLEDLQQTFQNTTRSNISGSGAGDSVDTMSSSSISYGDEAIQNGETYYYIIYEEPDTIIDIEEGASVVYDGTIYGVMVQLGTDSNGEATVTATYYRMEQDGDTYTIAETYTTGTDADGKISFGENDYATVEFTNTYTTGVTLQKTGTDGTTILNGAQFTLTYRVTETDEDAGTVNEREYYLKVNEDGTSEWVEITGGDENTEVESFTLGSIILDTPKAGSYTLTEVGEPEGYNKLPQAIVFEVDEDDLIDEESVRFADGSDAGEYVKWDPTSMTLTIINETSAELPKTGGAGTAPFAAAGLVLILGAGGCFLCRKRRGGDAV